MKEGITGRFEPQSLTGCSRCRLTGADKVVHCTDDRTLVLIFSPFFIRCLVHILLGRLFGQVPVQISVQPYTVL